MEKSGQHWVTKSYLDAWIDPLTPTTYSGYLWQFEKHSCQSKKKAPHNIFKEANFYTRFTKDGTRDLSLENNLSALETKFLKIRKLKLNNRMPLSLEEVSTVIIFVASMLHRTKLRRDNEKALWSHMLAVADDAAQYLQSTPSKYIKPKKPVLNNEPSMSHDEVREFAQQPMPNMLPTATAITSDILTKMSAHILCAPNSASFITSDHPCVVFDTNPNTRLLALGSPSIEIIFPISPRLMVIFFWMTPIERFKYMEVDEAMVDEFNRRIRYFCDEYFISNQANVSFN